MPQGWAATKQRAAVGWHVFSWVCACCRSLARGCSCSARPATYPSHKAMTYLEGGLAVQGSWHQGWAGCVWHCLLNKLVAWVQFLPYPQSSRLV